MSIFTGLVAQWIFRRLLELGGIAGMLLTAWNGLPPQAQEAVLALLGARWQQITLGSLVPVAAALWGYVWSFLSTVKPQVVTADKRQIPLSPAGAAEAEAVAKLAPPRKRTLIDLLMGR